MVRLSMLLLFLVFAPAAVQAAPMDDEIDRLIRSIGRDGCTFVRNGRQYTRRNARAHLRSKVERNAHLIDSTEDFIRKLASSSATTGQPYLIRCTGRPETTANAWFSEMLAKQRALDAADGG